jgi:hypothetical protein
MPWTPPCRLPQRRRRAEARARQLPFDPRGEVRLGQTFGLRLLRRDAGQQDGFGIGPPVARRPAGSDHRRTDLLQIQPGAQARELRRPVAARLRTEGLVVVPEEGGGVGQ